jgi:hypothetical protein
MKSEENPGRPVALLASPLAGRVGALPGRETAWEPVRTGEAGADRTLEWLWRSLPEERESLHSYIDRAKAFRNDCGCAMGGVFAVCSLGALGLYGFFFHRSGHLTTYVVVGAAIVLGASVVGKLSGIAIARMRLVLLYRELRMKYPVEGD